MKRRFTLHLALERRRLAPAVAPALCRVLQEAIINIVRRAAATKVGVALEASDAEVKMIIEDKGRGFSPDIELSSAPTKGLGRRGIRERLSLVSGRQDVESTAGQGRAPFVAVSP